MQFSVILYFLIVAVVKKVLTMITSDLFTIRTEGCTIASFPEVSESVRNLVGPPLNTLKCDAATKLVASNLSHVWVVHENLYSFNVFREDTFYCCYKNFSAPTNIENILYSECNVFSTVIKVEHEFVRIQCYDVEEIVYDDFLLFPNLKEIAPKSSQDENSFNILILGIESMSRLNFHRTMPLTSMFLKARGIVELLGYNKVGDNSFPNLFPVLTGLSYDYVKQTCLENFVLNVNKCKFIWDKFKEKGYHTALGSDSTAGLLGNYEYSLPWIPTDSYLQPFIFETRKLFTNQKYNFHQCLGHNFFYKILLDYTYELTHQLKLNKLFGLFWEESISHEDLNSPYIMDESYFNFLTKLDQDNYLNTTILILLSDHGMRWGEIVHTDQGRLEERLPLLGILFPDKFRSRYKLAYEHFQLNANRLTTPYDIYETLLDLLNPASLDDDSIREKSNNVKSIFSDISKTSLFVPVSTIRNCTSVGIKDHWCACHRGEKIKVGNKIKNMAANKLVEKINQLLTDYKQCHKLVINEIYDVYMVDNNKLWRIYTVMVKTDPGGAIFDGTLIQDRSRWVVSGTVSRLNLYRNQSDCVTDSSVKMYCYCG